MADVLYDVVDGVGVITLNRPERLNAVTVEMGRAYNEALLRADADPRVRTVVLTGAGRGFCSGADISAVGDVDVEGAAAEADGMRPELAFRLRKPLIAAVNGAAVGLGFALALTADIRVVAVEAKLSTAFARLGLVAEYGTAWLLPRLVGLERAMDLLLSGRTITGEEAQGLGLAMHALPADEVLPFAMTYAAELARSCSPRSLAIIRAQVHVGAHQPLDQAFTQARDAMLVSFGWPDLAEGFAAQAERRVPEFEPLEASVDTTSSDTGG